MSLEDKVAFITGGTQGIGLAAARSCLSLGMKVAICARSIDMIDCDLKNSLTIIPCDVRKESDVNDTVRKVFEQFGRIDVLINSAGVSMPEPLNVEMIPADLWDRILDTNTKGVFLTCKAVLPIMKQAGTGLIINILSTGAFKANKGNSPYSASKFAARALTEALIEETQNTGIRVSSISPGPVATNIWSKKKRIVTDEEKKRMLTPDDIGNIIAFLCLQPPHVHIENITVVPKFPSS